MILLLLFLLALPALAQEYPPVLVDVLGYDVLRHHFQKNEVPVFSVLGGGKRSLMTVRLVEVPDSTQRATVELPGGARRVVRVEGTATRCYDLRGARQPLDGLVKGGSYVMAYYDAAEPIVTEVVSLEGDPDFGLPSGGRPRTLPVSLGGIQVYPPQGWQAGAYQDLTPRLYHGKLRPHLFVSRPSGGLAGALDGLTEIASDGTEHLALWTFEDKVLAVRLSSREDGLVVALFCLLEDYRGLVPGYLEAVGNLGP